MNKLNNSVQGFYEKWQASLTHTLCQAQQKALCNIITQSKKSTPQQLIQYIKNYSRNLAEDENITNFLNSLVKHLRNEFDIFPEPKAYTSSFESKIYRTSLKLSFLSGEIPYENTTPENSADDPSEFEGESEALQNAIRSMKK